MNDITFFQRFERDILAGRKTITIRDESEAHFKAGQVLREVINAIYPGTDNFYVIAFKVLSS